MPSGAKKRKAAKRRKEQEQEQEQQLQQQLGAHPPDSPTSSPTAGLPHPPEGGSVRSRCEAPTKGNDEREEEDDLTSQEGKGSDGSSEFPSPTAQDDNHRCLEVESDQEQAESRVEAGGKEKGKKESETTGMDDTVCAIESSENGGREQPSESLAPQKTEEEVTKKIEVEVPVSVVEVQKYDILEPPPSDASPPTSVEVPISEVEEVSAEHRQPETDKEVDESGDTFPLIEDKQRDTVDTASPVEPSLPVSEEVVQASDVSVESLEVVESVAEAPSNKNEDKVVPFTDAAIKQPDLGVESHPHSQTHEVGGTTEVARSSQLQQRTSWMSCCGLFDVITGANR